MKAMLVLFCLFAAAALSQAQTTFGSIAGLVTDPAGAVAPGVRVVARHVATNQVTRAETNREGIYTLAQLRDGEYVVEMEASGFRKFTARNVTLSARENRRLDVQLQLGDTQQQIEVTAEASLIETESARLSDTKAGAAMNTLPVTSRSLRNFLVQSPTVVQQVSGDGGRIRIGGSQFTQTDYSIDGISINNGFNGNAMPTLIGYIESMEEVRIDSSNNSAEFAGMGQVTVVSKSGSNELHGSGFTYYSTPAFRARNPFAQERGSGITHQPGYSIGGPVWIPKLYKGRNRTFFHHTTEATRGGQLGQLLNANVPVAAWRSGDFSALLPSTAIRDPLSRAPFAGNRIPASRLNSVSQKLQDRFLPAPNFGNLDVFAAGNFRQVVSRPFDPDTLATAKIDHRFAERHSVFVRGTYARTMFNQIDGNLPGFGLRWQRRDARNLSASYTWALTGTAVNELRGGFSYNNTPRNGSIKGQDLVRELGLTGLAADLPDVNGTPAIQFQNLNITNMQTGERHRKPGFLQSTAHLQEMISVFRGKHSMKMGLNFMRVINQDQQQPVALFGQAQFSNRFTNHTYADFLLGIPTSVQRAFPVLFTDQQRLSYDLFFNDDFKVTRSLTVNLGLRYELHPGWTARNGLQSRFDITSGKILVPDGTLRQVSPLLPSNFVDVVEARTLGLPGRSLVRTDRDNFAPRIGFAWRPFGNRTVIRGGYAMFYDLVNRPLEVGVPFNIAEPQFVNDANNPTVIFPRIFPAASGGPTSVILPADVRTNLQIPRSTQYSFTIEHQRWETGFRASYIGANTRQGEWTYNANQPVADARLFVDKARPFPTYPVVDFITNGAGHQYHGLTLEAERKMKRGLQWQLAWSYQRDIGDVERGARPEDAFNLRRERGPSPDFPQQGLVGNFIYDLPFGAGKRWASSKSAFSRYLLGGWTVSMSSVLQTGQFLSPAWTGPDPTGTRFTNNRTAPQVSLRPNALRDGNLEASDRTLTRWFDMTAFTAPTPGQFGSAGNGLIVGPGMAVYNAGIYKEFSFVERFRMRWEMAASNAFNHPNYDAPNMNITSGQTGVINRIRDTLDLATQRALRMGLRVEW
ncbi:MAG: carboxypeptidase regulatory-like domain-containing protein [Bryobacterales bacterium]|nr:carboxypeptidase regulatory-like domain-containing protein [Bryobacterales bacterium]